MGLIVEGGRVFGFKIWVVCWEAVLPSGYGTSFACR